MVESRADNAAAVRLADATRRLLRATRLTRGDDTTLESIADDLVALSERLEAEPTSEVLWITGLDSFEDFEVSTDVRRMFPYSPATGVLNAIAPRVSLDLSHDEVRGQVTFDEVHNGPPFGFVHGGIISLVFDELLAAAAMAADDGGYTGRLTVHYRNVTPVLTPIELHARVTERNGRKFMVHGEMRLNGEVLSEGEGLFIRPKERPDAHAWELHAPAPVSDAAASTGDTATLSPS